MGPIILEDRISRLMSQVASWSEVRLEVRRSVMAVRQAGRGAGAGMPRLTGTPVVAVLEMRALLFLEGPHFCVKWLEF